MAKKLKSRIRKTAEKLGFRDFWELLRLNSGKGIQLKVFRITLSYLKKVAFPVFSSRQRTLK
jgi:hypothetical protein